MNDRITGKLSLKTTSLNGTLSTIKSRSGVSNYDDLSNKPKLNGFTISGDKVSADYDLQSTLSFDESPIVGSKNPVKSNGVYQAISAAKAGAISQTDIEKILYMDM